MLKKTLLSLVVCVGLVSSVNAQEELKANMNTMASNLSSVQMGFFKNDKKATLASIIELKKNVYHILGDEKAITKMLPADVQYKSSIAVNTAELINRHIDEIEDILTDKNMRMINRQMRSQKAFLEIEKQCFRCHNLVRDWE